MESLYYMLLGALIGVVIAVPPFFLISRKRKKKLADLAGELPEGAEVHSVRFCTEERYRKVFKFFPWEGVGVIEVGPGESTLHASPNKGEPFRLRFGSDDIHALGRPDWALNGFTDWLVLEAEGKKLYLGVETGLFIFGSRNRNGELLSRLTV